MTLVKLDYFKPRGKYYTSGEYQTEKRSFHEVLDEIRKFMADGTLPGLVTGCREFTVFLESQEPWGVPHLFPVDAATIELSDSQACLSIQNGKVTDLKMENEKLWKRLERAKACLSKLDAGVVRAVMHQWRSVDEVVLASPSDIAEQILRALDALAIVQEFEHEAQGADEGLAKAFGAPSRPSR